MGRFGSFGPRIGSAVAIGAFVVFVDIMQCLVDHLLAQTDFEQFRVQRIGS